MSKVIIIGGGHAGANVAFSLRKDGLRAKLIFSLTKNFCPIIDRHSQKSS